MPQTLKNHAKWSVRRTCEGTHCNHRQRITAPDLFTAFGRGKFGGTESQVRYECGRCKAHQILPQDFLPKGLASILPTEETRNSVSAQGLSPAKPQDATQTSLRPKAVSRAAPHRPTSKPARRQTEASSLPQHVPHWITGSAALQILCQNLRTAFETGGAILPLVTGPDGGLQECKLRLTEVRTRPERILDVLDLNDIDLLIVSGTSKGGARWQTLFHPLAGAASMIAGPVS